MTRHGTCGAQDDTAVDAGTQELLDMTALLAAATPAAARSAPAPRADEDERTPAAADSAIDTADLQLAGDVGSAQAEALRRATSATAASDRQPSAQADKRWAAAEDIERAATLAEAAQALSPRAASGAPLQAATAAAEGGPLLAGAQAVSAAPWHEAVAAHGAAPFEAELAAAVGGEEFAPALGAQLNTLIRDGVSHARLNLHPADLGPVAVHIRLDGDLAQVDFSAAHALTRQALEGAVPALASALRDSGLTLSGGGVFEQAPDRRDARDGAGDDAAARGNQRDHASAGDGMALAAAAPGHPRSRSRGVVDLYA